MTNEFVKALKVSLIAEYLGVDYKIDHDLKVVGFSDTNNPIPYTLCLYVKGEIPSNQKGLVLITEEKVEGFSCLVVDNPRRAVAELITHISSEYGFKKKFAHTNIHETVKIGQNVVVEEDVQIGQGTVIGHNTVIKSGTLIGENCLIGSNVTIGAEGYGFIIEENNTLKYPSLGGVEIGHFVEIGANTSIARGNVNDTYLGDYAKIDALVNIAHDCKISSQATITAGVTFCGYVNIGERARIAPNAVIKQRITIGSDAIVGLGAVVMCDVADGASVLGNPARKTFTSK